jgi:hypothetical protein
MFLMKSFLSSKFCINMQKKLRKSTSSNIAEVPLHSVWPLTFGCAGCAGLGCAGGALARTSEYEGRMGRTSATALGRISAGRGAVCVVRADVLGRSTAIAGDGGAGAGRNVAGTALYRKRGGLIARLQWIVYSIFFL